MEITTLLGRTQSDSSQTPLAAHLLVSAPADGMTNMALDEALLRRAGRTGSVFFRVYAWAAPTVSLGRNQPGRGCYDLGIARRRGIDFVRRPTGGRAILHHREITYAVAAPVVAWGSLTESYRAINRLLLEALRTIGIEAREAEPSSRAPAPSMVPCFDSPVAGELVVGGGKLVGSAQVRDGPGFLQHGSILLEDDQELLNQMLVQREAWAPPATVRDLLGRSITVQEFADSLMNAVGRCTALQPQPMEPDESLLSDARSLVDTRYGRADWTWRR